MNRWIIQKAKYITDCCLMDFHHRSLNDMARPIPPDHVFFFFPLRQCHQIIQRSIMKTSLLPKGRSSNIHEHKVLLSIFQDTKWQEPRCTKQLNFAKMHLNPRCLRIFSAYFIISDIKPETWTQRLMYSLKLFWGREQQRLCTVLNLFCNPLSIC